MTSTIFMMTAGETKCMPINFSFRDVSLKQVPSIVMDMEEVFDAIIQVGLHIFSSAEKFSAFTSTLSKTASMTRSTSSNPSSDFNGLYVLCLFLDPATFELTLCARPNDGKSAYLLPLASNVPPIPTAC